MLKSSVPKSAFPACFGSLCVVGGKIAVCSVESSKLNIALNCFLFRSLCLEQNNCFVPEQTKKKKKKRTAKL